MREIKFRQPIFRKNKFIKFHYWGFIQPGIFTGLAEDISNAEKLSQQYTGLKDKNGKEIYEGDYLNDWMEGLYVGWCDKCNSYELFNGWDNTCMSCSGDIQWIEVVTEKNKIVIGNIYENPELLKDN